MDIQLKFNKLNIIYKIVRDIDLKGVTLTIPKGCTLDFLGGSFSNGKLQLNNTYISGNNIDIYKNITLEGKIKNNVNPDWFIENNDRDKVQKSVDLVILEVSDCVIVERTFDITGNPIIFNKGQYPRRAIRIIGNGGGFLKKNTGAMFSSTNSNFGDIYLSNLSFYGDKNIQTFVYDTEKIIRIHSNNNFYKTLWRVYNSPNRYTQTVRTLNDSYINIFDTVFFFRYCYDIICDGILVEESNSFILDNHEGSFSTSLSIINSVLEGLTGKIISISGVNTLNICNNYFEFNKGYFDIIENGCRVLTFNGNFILEDKKLDKELDIFYIPLYKASLYESFNNNTILGSDSDIKINFIRLREEALNPIFKISGSSYFSGKNIVKCTKSDYFIDTMLNRGIMTLSTGMECYYKSYGGLKLYSIITKNIYLEPKEKKSVKILNSLELNLTLSDMWTFLTPNSNFNIKYDLQYTGENLIIHLENTGEEATSIEGYILILKMVDNYRLY